MENLIFFNKKKKEWDSGLKVIKADELEIRVPYLHLALIEEIEKEIKTEYAFLSKIEKIDNAIIVAEEYEIPSQECSFSSVKILNTEKYLKYDVIYHKHPFQSSSFSKTDEDYINSNFKLSILISSSGLSKASFRLKYENILFQIETTNIKIIYPRLKIKVDYSKFKTSIAQYYSGFFSFNKKGGINEK